MDMLAQEGIRLNEVRNRFNDIYHVVVPENVKPKNHIFELKFDHLADVCNFDVCNGLTMVCPVTRTLSDGSSMTMMLIQMEYEKGSFLEFSPDRDWQAFNFIQNFMRSVFVRIINTRRS